MDAEIRLDEQQIVEACTDYLAKHGWKAVSPLDLEVGGGGVAEVVARVQPLPPSERVP